MKLMRFGLPGNERPGLIDADGMLRDLSGHVDDINGRMLKMLILLNCVILTLLRYQKLRPQTRYAPVSQMLANLCVLG